MKEQEKGVPPLVLAMDSGVKLFDPSRKRGFEKYFKLIPNGKILEPICRKGKFTTCSE